MKLFMVNSALSPDQTRLLGARPDKYPDWVGSLVPNDEEGGYLMLKELIRLHPPVAPGQTIDLLAFSGIENHSIRAVARERHATGVGRTPRSALATIGLRGLDPCAGL